MITGSDETKEATMQAVIIESLVEILAIATELVLFRLLALLWPEAREATRGAATLISR
ncbi:MAG: hypothetical protein ACYCTL_00550 [Acidimicrobiales bacterium]